MPKKGRRRSAAQIRQTDNMKGRRRTSPEEAGEGGEVEQPLTDRVKLGRAERDAERSRKDLRNAERRVRTFDVPLRSLLNSPIWN
jgi:hypothetical protein